MAKQLSFEYALGIEELVVALSQAGYRDEAKILLATQGEISKDEVNGRLISAHHSLLAKNLVIPIESEIHLSKELDCIIKLIHSSKTIVRTSRTGLYGEEILSHYHDQDIWLEHRISKQVEHHFRYPLELDNVRKSTSDFLGPVSETERGKIVVDLPESFLSMLSSSILKSKKDVMDFLQPVAGDQLGVPLLAEDLVNGKWRGSTLWIESLDDEQVQTRGALWVQGHTRFWMISSVFENDQPMFKAALCPQKEFVKHLKALIC